MDIPENQYNENWRSLFDIPLAKVRGGYLDEFKPHCWSFWAQCKMDGYRMSLQIGKEKNWLVGRNRKDKMKGVASAGDWMVYDFQCWIDQLHDSQLVGSMFDGELEWPGHAAAEISTAIATGRTNEFTFTVFDVLFWKGKDLREMPYRERFDFCKQAVKIADEDRFRLVETFETITPEEVQQYFKQGWEGFVFKNPDSVYYAGAPNCWYKLKGSVTVEGFVTGFTEGKSGGSPTKGIKPTPNGKVATFTVAMMDGSKPITVATVGDPGKKDHSISDIGILEAPKYFGQVMEFDASGWDSKKFRWARFKCWRDDKTQHDCVLSEQIGGK